MNCHKFREKILKILFLQPSPTIPADIQEHLSRCHSCKEWWEKEEKFEQWLTSVLSVEAISLPAPAISVRRTSPVPALLFHLLWLYSAGVLLFIILLSPFYPLGARWFFLIQIILPSWWQVLGYLLLLFTTFIISSLVLLPGKYSFQGVKGK